MPDTADWLAGAAKAKAVQKEWDKQWNELWEVLSDCPTFGLYSIFRMHPWGADRGADGGADGAAVREGRRRRIAVQIAVKVLPLLMLAVQIAIPFGLFYEKWKSLPPGVCPGGATMTTKILMVTIAMLYFVRATLNGLEQLMESSHDDNNAEKVWGMNPRFKAIKEKRKHFNLEASFLGDIGTIDEFMSIGYENFIMLLNLWFVFIADDAFEMVMDSLAMEFVARLDNEFKETYMKVNAGAVARILREKEKFLKEKEEKEKPCWPWELLKKVLIFAVVASMIVLPVASLGMVFYGAVCKG